MTLSRFWLCWLWPVAVEDHGTKHALAQELGVPMRDEDG